jgi:DNA-binding MarR family transcriptional regulator
VSRLGNEGKKGLPADNQVPNQSVFSPEMLLPRDIPNPAQIAALERRYGCVDGAACEACILLLHTANDVVGAFATHLSSHEVSQGRFIVLMMLNREPEKHFMPSQLAEMCCVTKATMTGLVDGLERDGLVTRHPSQDDRRATFVSLSPAGLALLDRILPPHFERVAALMQGLSPEERKDLSRLLAKVRAGVDRVRALNSGLPIVRAECTGA